MLGLLMFSEGWSCCGQMIEIGETGLVFNPYGRKMSRILAYKLETIAMNK